MDQIDVDTLRDWLDRDEPVTVLDIRRAADRAEWQIPGSIHFDVYDALREQVPDTLSSLELPADRPVVTVCVAGQTAIAATRQLRERGYEAMTLRGGMRGWSLAWNAAQLQSGNATVVQVRRTGKGCLSYIVASNDEAVVIDPSVDPEVYIDLAAGKGWTITRVIETHIHADHLMRGRRLAELARANLYLPETDRASFPRETVRNGDVVIVGDVELVSISTPGHTPEAMSYLLDGRALFTGDTLFLAAVGRPDLEASVEGARERAHYLYRSLARLVELPDDTLILPSHTSDPIPFDHQPVVASLKEVRRNVRALHLGEDEFVELILSRIPATPPNHHEIVQLNEAGEYPEDRVVDLEAGANRCAVS